MQYTLNIEDTKSGEKVEFIREFFSTENEDKVDYDMVVINVKK